MIIIVVICVIMIRYDVIGDPLDIPPLYLHDVVSVFGYHGNSTSLVDYRHRSLRHRTRVVGATDIWQIVFVETERAAHKAVKAEYVAHELQDVWTFPTIIKNI